jgi:hypothetical protein
VERSANEGSDESATPTTDANAQPSVATSASRIDEADRMDQAATDSPAEGGERVFSEEEPPPRPSGSDDGSAGASTPQPAGATEATTAREAGSLLSSEEKESLDRKWEAIQATFVDEPRQAVRQADALVGEVMNRLSEMFSGERAHLEAQWDRGDEVSTEDLRVALQRYRSFFQRLLAA